MSKTKLAIAAIAAIVVAFSGQAALAQNGVEPAKTAQAAAESAAPLSTNQTPLGDLLGNPATKAIVDKHLPGLSENPQVQMALPMTLKSVQPFSGGKITDEALAAIDIDLAKLPAKK